MLNGAHASTGVLAGVALATAARPTPAGIALGALVGAGAALLPDIDHDRSTITQSAGPVTRCVAELLQAVARWTYRTTALPHDPRPRGKVGEHRGLIHTPAFAILLGTLIAVGTVLSAWVGIVVVYALTSAALRSLRWSLPRVLRSPLRLHWPISPPLYALVATAALVYVGALDDTGWWLGGIVTTGMIVHSLGDGLTNSGIPFAWPVRRWCDRCRDHGLSRCAGARWDRQHVLPQLLRFPAGAAREKLIELACLAAAALLAWPTLAPLLAQA